MFGSYITEDVYCHLMSPVNSCSSASSGAFEKRSRTVHRLHDNHSTHNSSTRRWDVFRWDTCRRGACRAHRLRAWSETSSGRSRRHVWAEDRVCRRHSSRSWWVTEDEWRWWMMKISSIYGEVMCVFRSKLWFWTPGTISMWTGLWQNKMCRNS